MERFETHTRAFIKVEDGCNRQCAYCVIPRARGPVRSRDEASILAELRQLAASGYREVVLSAISLPSYGLDTGTNLVELVEHCAQVEGIQRIRLGSLDPDMLTPEFITRLAAVEKLCPQFHLSLQSGCTATLRRMRRVYTAEQYAQVVDQLRAAYGARPVSFTTDCICGFPGETQADFEESCEFLKKIGFLKVHVFPYSRRSGTPAYDFPEQVHEREKQERSRVMNGIAEEVRREVLAAHVGTEDDVLLETPALRHPVHRLHPAVHPGGGVRPRPCQRRRSCMYAWANTTASVSVQHFAEFTRLKLLILYTRTNTTNF